MRKIIVPNVERYQIQFNPRRLLIKCEHPGSVSDGYHTFDELYRHRCLLYLAFLGSLKNPSSFRSRIHSDGSSSDGWFIAGASLHGSQISYHLPESMWELANFLPTVDKAPDWDGHSSSDVCDRLQSWIEDLDKRIPLEEEDDES